MNDGNWFTSRIFDVTTRYAGVADLSLNFRDTIRGDLENQIATSNLPALGRSYEIGEWQSKYSARGQGDADRVRVDARKACDHASQRCPLLFLLQQAKAAHTERLDPRVG